MKKGKFLAVAIIVSLILLVQPNIRTTIWNFFDSQDIVSQLGFKGSSIPNVKSTQPSVTNDSEKQEIQKKQKEIIQSLKEFTFEGQQLIEVNGNQPVFSNSDLTIPSNPDYWEEYSNLDLLNRVGVANALLSKSAMPTEERKSIAHVKPTGWKNKKIIFNGKQDYLYNRSHLIGFQLTGQNDNPKNLFTGTRALNANFEHPENSMVHFENKVAEYIRNTNHHVRYQVTPIFKGVDMVCSGVWMQAQSIEDQSIKFSVYIFNVQPNYTIDYLTGNSKVSN